MNHAHYAVFHDLIRVSRAFNVLTAIAMPGGQYRFIDVRAMYHRVPCSLRMQVPVQ